MEIAVYDLTALTYHGDKNPLAQYGHVYKITGEKQINMVLGVTLKWKLPLHHKTLPGKIVSVSMIHSFVKELKVSGIKNIVFILDRGFYSKRNIKEITDIFMKGVGGLIPLASLMMLAFAIGDTCDALGTGPFVAQAANSTLPHGIIPAVVFLISCFIAFSTGTSWGTFAIMIPIAVPMIDLIGLHPGLLIAAVLGGGVFGDHCSPISDTTIISSMASATDHIDHVRTQLPYALLAGGLAFLLYVLFGYIL